MKKNRIGPPADGRAAPTPPPTFFKLRVRPGSRKTSVFKKADDVYEIHVRAPAERGLANAEALGLLARALDCPPNRLRLVKGGTSPHKIIQRL